MSTLVRSARPGPTLGIRPERRDSKSSEVDRRVAAWLKGRRLRALTMKGFQAMLAEIEVFEARWPAPGSEQFRREVFELGRRLRVEGVTRSLALRAFAGVRSALRHTKGIDLHPEQLFAGWVMLQGGAAEMQTGEGKTVTASLPAVVMGLAGTPVHVVTVNDYLVARDAAELEPLYELFGLRATAIVESTPVEERRRAYSAHVVYVTHKQLVFDYLRDLQQLKESRAGLRGELRDLLAPEAGAPLMRGLCFAVVDEADATLIDDARTPLILAQPIGNGRDLAAEAAVALSLARGLHADVDFRVAEETRSVWITDSGRDELRRVAGGLNGVWRFERYRNELVRQALMALHLYRVDRDYLVKDDKVQLIDEGSGRILTDRRLQHGLHRMLEVKERCPVTEDNEVVAGISFQRFFARYHQLAGMSGTLWEVRAELRQVYGLEVVQVPTHRPCLRETLPLRTFASTELLWDWVVEEVARRHSMGQPVLVGTRSVAQSERISELLRTRGVPHQVLNARQDAEEAAIVADAGKTRAVTVATNMAGRGTDIPLDARARARGGLHVMALALNDSLRVERQLFGRSARQGDPGSAQALVALDDELVRRTIPVLARRLVDWSVRSWPSDKHGLAVWVVRFAQKACERRHRRERMRIYNKLSVLDRRLAVGGDPDLS